MNGNDLHGFRPLKRACCTWHRMLGCVCSCRAIQDTHPNRGNSVLVRRISHSSGSLWSIVVFNSISRTPGWQRKLRPRPGGPDSNRRIKSGLAEVRVGDLHPLPCRQLKSPRRRIGGRLPRRGRRCEGCCLGSPNWRWPAIVATILPSDSWSGDEARLD